MASKEVSPKVWVVVTVLVAVISCIGVVAGAAMPEIFDYLEKRAGMPTATQPDVALVMTSTPAKHDTAVTKTSPATAVSAPDKENLVPCESFSPEESTEVQSGTYVLGNVTVGDIQYSNGFREETIVYVEGTATITASFGTSCYQGGASLLYDLIATQWEQGCGSGCDRVRVVIVHPDGKQDISYFSK